MKEAEWIYNNQGYQVIKDIIISIRENRQYLSELDGKIGDGDHGVNMSKGFTIADQRINEDQSLSDGFRIIGEVLLMEIGGSMGPIYGTFFDTFYQVSKDNERITASVFYKMFNAAINSTIDVCGASPGDKTLIDTMLPALHSLENSLKSGNGFSIALNDMVAGARDGMNSTVNMVARMGRSARLGDRSVGYIDPGAASCYIILESMASSIRKLIKSE